MKTKVYLRVAKCSDKTDRAKVAVSTKPKYEALSQGTDNNKVYLPTVLIGLELNIPDIEFDASRIDLVVDVTHTEPATEVRQIE